MNLLDGIILIPIIYFAIRGLQNGLIKEILSLIGLIIALFISFKFMYPVSASLQVYMPNSSKYLPYISAVLLFFGTLIIVKILIVLLTKVVNSVELGIPNRILGFLFGTFKSALFLSIMLILLAGFNLPTAKTRDKSITYPYVIKIAPETFSILSTVYPEANNYVKTIDKTIKHYQSSINFTKTNKK